MTPFDYVTAINQTKKDLMEDKDDASAESGYVPFITNKTLSYFPETVMHANRMNTLHHLDKKLQFHYFLNSIRSGKRFAKWLKKDSDDLEIVCEYYGYSTEKAKVALRLLTPQQIALIKIKLTQGVGDEFSRKDG